MKTECADGKSWTAGLTLADRLPHHQGDIKASEGVSRIMLSNRNRNASLAITGTTGKPCIRIGVDASDVPELEILDADGKVVGHLLQGKVRWMPARRCGRHFLQ
jgi:ABC-type amino acid transport substrate-binding protein